MVTSLFHSFIILWLLNVSLQQIQSFRIVEYKNVHCSQFFLLTLLAIGLLFIPSFDNQLERTKYICVLIIDFEYCLWRWLWNVTYYICVKNVYKMFGLSHFNKNKCMILLNCYVLVKWHCMYDALLKICILYFTKRIILQKRFFPIICKLYLYIFSQLSLE